MRMLTRVVKRTVSSQSSSIIQSNLAHKHIKVKMADFLNEEQRRAGFFFDDHDDRTDHLPLITKKILQINF
jgi:hypothetical protein